MLLYSCDQLRLLNHAGPPTRLARKSIFRHRLWQPCKSESVVTSGDSVRVPPITNNVNNNVNKPSATDLDCSAQTSLKVGWLNVQSLSNKTSAVLELIDDKHLDVLVLTETWHRSSDDISLRLAAPADFTAVDVVRTSDPAHGGVVFLHRKRHKCTRLYYHS